MKRQAIHIRLICGGGVAMLALFAASATGANPSAFQEATYTLTQDRPGRSTAEHFAIDYRDPAMPEGKPHRVLRLVTVLPRGARHDVSAPDSCEASDDELEADGAAACPPGSAIGGGVVTVDTGLPEPGRYVTADVDFFNNATDPQGEFIYVNTVRGSGLRTVIRADVAGRRTITDIPELPGTPPEGGVIDTVDVTVANVRRTVNGETHSYITTPGRCRKRGFWMTRLEFAYEGDVKQTVRTKNPCHRPHGATKRGRR